MPGLFGPLSGVRLGDIAAYEFELPPSFTPWPGRTLLERTFVLLDLGVSMSDFCWREHRQANGDVVQLPSAEEHTWYVDLISVDAEGDRYVFRDLFIDVEVPLDGRHYRTLDLDEFADALADGLISQEQAVRGLHGWQRFLDRHLHADRHPSGSWTDFPPAVLRPLLELPSPIGDPVRWEEHPL
jgi:hypothetical protein